jgi:hypothetical protein
MSSTIWINLRNGEQYESNESDHSAMLALDNALAALAASLSIRALSSFYDDTDFRYNLDETGEFEELEDGWPASAAQWFDPADALRSVDAILTYLQAHAEAIDTDDRWTQADVEDDLLDCKAELERAVAAGKSIHFCIVM